MFSCICIFLSCFHVVCLFLFGCLVFILFCFQNKKEEEGKIRKIQKQCVFCVHWYLHPYIHMYIHAYIHPCINKGVYTFLKNFVFFLVKLSLLLWKQVYIHAYIHPRINIHVCIQIYECIYGCIYIFFLGGKRFVINFFTIFLGVWHMDFVKLIPFWGFWKHGLKTNSLYKNKVLCHFLLSFSKND